MLTRIVSCLIAVCLFWLMPVTAGEVYAASGIPISAPSAVILDQATNRMLFAKTPYLRRSPASTTKLLTAIVVLNHLDLDHVVSIPAFAESIEPSKANLKQGERYSVKDLIRAMLISSANDAAEVLAVETAGSQGSFAKLMNDKAKKIGCRRSHFVHASGLPAKRQYSTAYDLALIMKTAQRSSFIVKTLRTKSAVIYSEAGRKIYLKNHNKLLWKDNRDIVGKTGWTKKARHCFVGRVQSQGKRVVISMLGSHRLWKDLKTLVDYQFGVTIYRIEKNRKIWSLADTRRIQSALKRSGFSPGPIDGKFGAKTVSAVERFQASRGLKVDGIVGPKTWRLLKRYS